ncbi:D-Ala-D-Ala carboxypeptidase family metallohydrolase [Luteolibacter flavescens]|uniref:D-Ala-D-Ala carboxypeptidase family metallohydrolase n=1 Tax=Luteolibacter flavescens TaxID=1859460 RepID=A0ABT3FIF8_9BACT|nr:D-Ala-D-Ala carboxypeptidase family metallohydrolase [Luteolibacter flavescens]MCW1883353.1 D-Ala-D-Ala carboxypeptidase family metallohydrolase [Luteolibacter flavescens]
MLIDPSRGESAHSSLQSRRGALGTLGAGALALLGSTGSASAFFSKKPKVTIVTASAPVDLNGLPPEWVALQGRELKAYSDFLTSLRLQRLTPRQVIEAHAKQRGTVWNSLPPRAYWRQMVPTLRVVDHVAMRINQPVSEILSAYRAPSYNARCPGARSGSYHQANVAVDVKFPVAPSTVAQTARTLRSSGLFRGGVGRYSSFTHIDTRGQNVDW